MTSLPTTPTDSLSVQLSALCCAWHALCADTTDPSSARVEQFFAEQSALAPDAALLLAQANGLDVQGLDEFAFLSTPLVRVFYNLSLIEQANGVRPCSAERSCIARSAHMPLNPQSEQDAILPALALLHERLCRRIGIVSDFAACPAHADRLASVGALLGALADGASGFQPNDK